MLALLAVPPAQGQRLSAAIKAPSCCQSGFSHLSRCLDILSVTLWEMLGYGRA